MDSIKITDTHRKRHGFDISKDKPLTSTGIRGQSPSVFKTLQSLFPLYKSMYNFIINNDLLMFKVND